MINIVLGLWGRVFRRLFDAGMGSSRVSQLFRLGLSKYGISKYGSSFALEIVHNGGEITP